MLTPQETQKLKKLVHQFFENVEIPMEVQVGSPEEKTIPVDIEMEEPQVLIGQKGRTLAQVQHLLKVILRKNIDKEFYINLDINDYKKKKEKYLREKARETADEVVLNKKEKVLPPMPAYERRIIHLELADRENVTTESIGQEPKRQVVIRPYP